MTERHGIEDTDNPFVYAIVEVPLQFTIKEPIEGGRMVDVDLTKGYYLMLAAGDMDETGEQPQKHRQVISYAIAQSPAWGPDLSHRQGNQTGSIIRCCYTS